MAPPCDLSKWFTGDWMSCLFDPVTATTTEAGFGVFVGGITLVALYVAGGGGIATPAVILILLGGVLIPLLPGAYVGIAQGIVIIGVFGGVMAVARRYVLSAAAQ